MNLAATLKWGAMVLWQVGHPHSPSRSKITADRLTTGPRFHVLAVRPHALRFPFILQPALAVWRALYFRPARYEPDAARPAEWNRGAYLGLALGHCNACHASRNALGATTSALDLAGGLIPVQNWYAPSLTSTAEAGVADWNSRHVIALIQTGVSPRGAVMGPMTEVVGGSTQYFSAADLAAMTAYLKALPQNIVAAPDERAAPAAATSLAAGDRLHARHCADCHGERGEGAPGAYPALEVDRYRGSRRAAGVQIPPYPNPLAVIGERQPNDSLSRISGRGWG